MDRMVGRDAHVLLIQNEIFLRMFAFRYGKLFV